MKLPSLIRVLFHKPVTVKECLAKLSLVADDAFYTTYKKHIYPKVDTLDQERLQALKSYKVRAPIAISITILIIAYTLHSLFNLTPRHPHYYGFLGSMCVLLYFWASVPERQFKKHVKEQVFPETLAFLGMDTFRITPPIALLEIYESYIIPKHDFLHLEDYVAGTYKDTRIELFEFFYGLGEPGTAQIFSGEDKPYCKKQRLIVRVQMNKNFLGKTLLIKKKGTKLKKPLFNRMQPLHKYTLLDSIASGESLITIGQKVFETPEVNLQQYTIEAPSADNFEKVSIENPDIVKRYIVLSTDQVEARYLLTLTFMERLNSLQNAFDSEFIECSFYNNELLLLIETKHDRMESKSIFEPTTYIEECQTLRSEITQIFGIIDELKLHEQTRL